MSIVTSYKRFLISEAKRNYPLVLSNRLISIINRIHDGISDDMINKINNDSIITYVDSTNKKDTVSFIQSFKVDELIHKNKDPWTSNMRQEIKIGKLVNKLFDKKYPAKDVEDFVNSYKASFEYNEYVDLFDIVKGSDITKYYQESNQVVKEGSNLFKSCMKYSETKKFIKCFFEPNDKTINTLVLRDKQDSDKIVGRANIWYLEKPKGRIFMDRIYTNEDYLTNIFIQYAKENDFLYKSTQIYGGSVIPIVNNGNQEKIIMETKMIPKKYEYYPYVDTLQFYNEETGILTSDTSKWSESGWIALIHAGGEYLTKDRDMGFKMDYIGRLIHPYFVVKSRVDDCYIHKNDAIYLEYIDDYCVPEREYVTINKKNYLKKDTKYIDGEYVIEMKYD